MTDEPDFQSQVLHRLDRIESMFRGDDDDPNNIGIFGKLQQVDREINYGYERRVEMVNNTAAIRTEMRESVDKVAKETKAVTDSITRYRWMGKGVVAGASLNLLVLAKLFSVGPL